MINLNEMKKDYIGREPRDYIVESVTVPEGLEEKVLAAMTQKRKEIEEIQKEKQEKKAAHKSVALRAAVIAAVITLMILIIPFSRQVVVSAAESAWNAFHSWVDDVFHVGMKQTKNGCTVEIVEARVANDFLYLTVKEDYTDFIANHSEYVYSKTEEYNRINSRYSGTIYDNEGNSLRFSSNEVNFLTDDVTVITCNNKEFSDTEKNNDGNLVEYRIYLSKLKALINSYDKKYTCVVHLNLSGEKNGQVSDNQLASFDFKFNIDKISSVMESAEYDIDYSYTLGNLTYDFKKIYVGPTESNFLVELIPINELSQFDIGKYYFNNCFDINCITCKVKEYSDLDDVNKLKNDVFFAFDQQLYISDSKYYICLSSYSNGNESNGYPYYTDSIINPDKETPFAVFSLGYVFKDEATDYEENVSINTKAGIASQNGITIAKAINNCDINMREENDRYVLDTDITLGVIKFKFNTLCKNTSSYEIKSDNDYSYDYILDMDTIAIQKKYKAVDKGDKIEA